MFKKYIIAAILFPAIFHSCTDLDESLLSEDSISTNLTAPVDPDPVLAEAYNDLNGMIGDQANLYALSEVTTDAAIVPTRGADWADNGIWRELHQHTWGVDHEFINITWDQWTELHCVVSEVIEPESNATTAQLGDAHFLRALAAYVILDNFGQVILCEPSEGGDDDVVTGLEALDFILADLDIALANLPEAFSQNSALLNRATQASARYLMAKVLLNRHIYLNTTPDPNDMNRVVQLVDDISASGFNLQQGYFDLFRDTPDNETIWYLPSSVGNRIYNGLHFNQVVEAGGGGWNGFATLSEYYDLFEGNANSNRPDNNQEERRGFVATVGTPFTGETGTTESAAFPGFTQSSSVGYGFLVGQQFEIDCAALTDRLGNPLAFERNFTDSNGNSNIEDNSEVTGIRVIKYHPQFGQGFTSHLIFFRYSDAHLMKAEAILRSGGDATEMINELRTLRGATPLNAVTEQDILDERARELYTEIWRRNDLIRFGQYTSTWELKDPSAIDNENLEVFPIPTAALTANSNLTQNLGY